jgi:hypothetical protein
MRCVKSIQVVSCLSVSFGLLSSAWAQLGVPVTAPAALNTNAATDSGGDAFSQVTTDGLGNWVAVWESDEDLGGTIGGDLDILVSRSADDGLSWSAPQALNTNAVSDMGSDYDVRVTTDGSGNWVAVWYSSEVLGGTIGADYDILVSRSADNGVTWNTPQALNANAATDIGGDAYPQVTTDNLGNWVAAWESENDLGGTIGTDWDILVSRSADNGLSWSAPQALNTNATTDSGSDYDVQVTTNGTGNWVAVWYSAENIGGTIGTDWDILVSRSADNGLGWSAPQALNANAASDSGNDRYPQVTTDWWGNWVVVWHSDDDLGGSIGTDLDILVSRSADNGATWGAPQPLNSNAGADHGSDEMARLTTDGTGTWVAVWRSADDLGGTIGWDNDILVARSGDNGTTWSAPQALNANAASDSGEDNWPQLTTDALGNWVAVWHSDDGLGGTIGSDPDILVARFALPDCNGNGVGDGQEIVGGASADCDSNGVPDECQPDSDGNGIIDACEVAGPCGCGATSAVLMSFWALWAMRLVRRRRVRA